MIGQRPSRPSSVLHRAGLQRLQRRLFLRGGLSLGAVDLLTGCNLEDDDAADRLLFAMSRWNDRVQAALFSNTRLASVYSESEITDPFPFNAYYKEAQAPVVDAERSGVKFSDFLARVGADIRARYVAFRCADDYSTSIDMATALHPQTLLALRFRDAVLPRKYGFPMKLRVPTKLGFKNPKHIVAINVTNDFPGGFWEKYGYNWFSGL
jgi:DMSO/TMAO reductase YedYZ molybdopterin-dependent catalytic subunit